MATVEKGTVKETELVSVGNLKKIRWKDGGKVPEALSGLYTSEHSAQKAIDQYLKTRRTPTNAKAKSGTK